MKVKDMMSQLLEAFVQKQRGDESITILEKGSPQWMVDVVREAHGDMMPDDTRYEMIREIVGDLTDHDPETWKDSDTAHEICDGRVCVYNADLLRWLSSHLLRAGYVEDAIEDHGFHGLFNALQQGQFREYEEIYHSVIQSILKLAEEGEDQ